MEQTRKLNLSGLIRLEMKKIMTMPSIICFVAVVLISGIMLAFWPESNHGFEADIYRSYIQQLAKMNRTKQTEYIDKENSRLTYYLTYNIETDYMSDRITIEELKAHNRLKLIAMRERPAFDAIMSKAMYFDELRQNGLKPVYYDDLLVGDLIGRVNATFIMLGLWVILFTVRPYFMDNESNLTQSVKATIVGRKQLGWVRFAVAMGVTVAASVLTVSVELICVRCRISSDLLLKPVYSMMGFGEYNMSIMRYLILQALKQVGCCMVLEGISAAAAKLIRNYLAVSVILVGLIAALSL